MQSIGEEQKPANQLDVGLTGLVFMEYFQWECRRLLT